MQEVFDKNIMSLAVQDEGRDAPREALFKAGPQSVAFAPTLLIQPASVVVRVDHDLPASACTGMSFSDLSGTATTTKSPAAAVPTAVDALAGCPSSATSRLNLPSPGELAIMTSWPLAMWLPASPAPMTPVGAMGGLASGPG
jgi:hypothetical protein